MRPRAPSTTCSCRLRASQSTTAAAPLCRAANALAARPRPWRPTRSRSLSRSTRALRRRVTCTSTTAARTPSCAAATRTATLHLPPACSPTPRCRRRQACRRRPAGTARRASRLSASCSWACLRHWQSRVSGLSCQAERSCRWSRDPSACATAAMPQWCYASLTCPWTRTGASSWWRTSELRRLRLAAPQQKACRCYWMADAASG
mmetsp:Transcript_33057/g.98366  ORF Transcript_33057/g.98366 Transcript_33057/m.98366 type:complete len:205 (-) Transcript_33057:129-743(-)